MFLASNFALSDSEDNTSGRFNRRGIAVLPLLRTLLAICQKLREPSFWEMMDSCFISIYKFGSFKKTFVLLAYISLEASRRLLQQVLAWLNFTLNSENLFCW